MRRCCISHVTPEAVLHLPHVTPNCEPVQRSGDGAHALEALYQSPYTAWYPPPHMTCMYPPPQSIVSIPTLGSLPFRSLKGARLRTQKVSERSSTHWVVFRQEDHHSRTHCAFLAWASVSFSPLGAFLGAKIIGRSM
jgi:hypothetical protein